MAALSVTGEVYCFPHRQIIFSFDRRVIGISIERFARVHSKIDFVCPSCLYHNIRTNSGT